MISTTKPNTKELALYSAGLTLRPLNTALPKHHHVKVEQELHDWAVLDHHGVFLCSTSDTSFILQLLEAEKHPFPDPLSRPHFRLGARELIDPGQGLRVETETLARYAKQRAEHEARLANASGDVSLESLGLA